jgi:hypothetical protein
VPSAFRRGAEFYPCPDDHGDRLTVDINTPSAAFEGATQL